MGGGESLKSENGTYHAKLQIDGILVVQKITGSGTSTTLWDSGKKSGQEPFSMYIQEDGNMVTYDTDGRPTFASHTHHKGTALFELMVQNDGNLVLYDTNSNATWASNTVQPYTDKPGFLSSASLDGESRI